MEAALFPKKPSDFLNVTLFQSSLGRENQSSIHQFTNSQKYYLFIMDDISLQAIFCWK